MFDMSLLENIMYSLSCWIHVIQ